MAPGQLDRAMMLGVGLNAGFVVVEITAGVWAGSLALLADAGHNASDVVGLLLAWGASWLARRPPSRRYTWGLGRATIFAALGSTNPSRGGLNGIGTSSVATRGLRASRSRGRYGSGA